MVAVAVASQPAQPGIPRRVVTSDPRVIGRAVDAFLSRDEPVMFDVETTGLDPRANKLVMVQLRQPTSPSTLEIDWRGFYTDDAGWADACRLVRESLRRLFKARMAVGHNIKFDSEFLLAQGVVLPKVYDTMLGEKLIHAGKPGVEYTLAATLKRRFGRDMSKLQREWFYKPAPLDEREADWNAPFPEEEIEYGAIDVECLPELYEAQRKDLARLGLREVAHIEMRALPAFAAMEMRGIRIDLGGWRAFIAEQAAEARKHEDEALSILGPHIMAERIAAFDAALEEWRQARDGLKQHEEDLKRAWGHNPDGESWGQYKKLAVAKYREANPIPAKPKLDTSLPNIGSQKQLIAAMRRLGIPVPTKKNDKGQVVETTDSDSLERLVSDYPALRPVLGHRKAVKFVDSFGETLLEKADAGQRVHPDYHQADADTGRTTCSDPNWQQIPSKGEGKRLRQCVIAGEGNVLITADFSNIELRCIADLSGDENMLAMFASGEDLHSYTARLMFDLGEGVNPKTTEWRGGLTYRQAAKIVNYLIPYGGSPFAIAAQNNMPLADAEDIVAKWFGMFPGVKRWMDGLQKAVHRDLCSRTMSGRVRWYEAPRELGPGAFSDYGAFRDWQRQFRKEWAAIERQARNTPVQGLSADITKLAVATFYEQCQLRMGVIVAVVHDEIVVESPEMHSGVVREILADAMLAACQRYLKRVALPRPEPTISDHWEHD